MAGSPSSSGGRGTGSPAEVLAAERAEAHGLVDGMGQLQQRVPLVGKVPPWRQPPTPDDPAAPRPFAWLGDDPLAPRTAVRGGGSSDDEGGPGDTPASVAWLRAGRGTGYEADRDRLAPAAARGRPAPSTPRAASWSRRRGGRTSSAGRPTGTRPRRDGRTRARPRAGRRSPGSSPSRRRRPAAARTVGLSDWERWLEFCARIDGFPRHLSIHSGGMLVTAAPLIDIAPIERATMVDRVVVQFDKRDVETLKLIKLDLLGLGMLAAMDETLQLIEHDCAVCLDLDRLPEDVPEVFEMLQAADTVGRLPGREPGPDADAPEVAAANLDDLVVEVAIIRPGPIQGNAVHPFLRRKQGLEPVTYLHPSLEPILQGLDGRDPLPGAGHADRHRGRRVHARPSSDGFRRAMGTWRSSREMEKLHQQFVDGCLRQPGMTEEIAEELFRQVAAFASFGFAKSHAAAFARTAYESSFLKLFYPAQFLGRAHQRAADGLLPGRGPRQRREAPRRRRCSPWTSTPPRYKTTTEWVGRPGEPLPDGAGIAARPEPVRSSACVIPSARRRATAGSPEVTAGWGVRLGLHLVKGIGEQHEALLDGELARGPYASLADVVERTGLPRGGPRAAHPDRGARLAGPAAARAALAAARGGGARAAASTGKRCGLGARPGSGPRRPAGRWTCGCPRPRRRTCRRSPSRSGSATRTRSSGSTRGGR